MNAPGEYAVNIKKPISHAVSFNTEYNVNILGEYAVNTNPYHMQKLDKPITVLHHIQSSVVNLLTRRVIQKFPLRPCVFK